MAQSVAHRRDDELVIISQRLHAPCFRQPEGVVDERDHASDTSGIVAAAVGKERQSLGHDAAHVHASAALKQAHLNGAWSPSHIGAGLRKVADELVRRCDSLRASRFSLVVH